MVFSLGVTRFPSWSALGAGLCAAVILAATVSDAEARRKKKRYYYSPPYASIVVDARSGRVLQATNPNSRRYPASITKVMTLYLVFEQLERGRLKLNSPITFSRNASRQPPSKLGIRPGQSISVRTAILALVTKSANDVAVAVAEHIGGTESGFAQLMNARARSLGMRRTNFANASGLPNPRQVTTARDLIRLGRAIQSHFPRYYGFFKTRSFRFGNRRYRNHNKLLGRVQGVDGIKTGYTRASGFNLLTSARRGRKHVIAVVLGGRSSRVRNAIMRRLIARTINRGATRTTIAAIPRPSASRKRLAATATRAPVARPRPAAGSSRKPKPPLEALLDRKQPPRPTVQAEARKNSPKPVVIASNPGRPIRLSAFGAGRNAANTGSGKRNDLIPTASIPNTRTATDGSTRYAYAATGAASRAAGTKTPSDLRWVRGPGTTPTRPVPPARISGIANIPKRKSTLRAKPATPVKQRVTQPRLVERPTASGQRIIKREGVMIQVGATDALSKAKALLSRARSRSRGTLTNAKPFTETIQRNGSTLYRARFAGLNERSARRACRTLKRSGLGCFTTRN